jgi:hypothetical protein
MGLSVTITSAHDGAVLEFYDYVGDSCKVSLRGSSFSGTATVHVLPDIPPLDLPSLETFFRGLAKQWSGWQGKKQWRSIDGELALATIDSTGHVGLLACLKSGPYPYDWSLTTTLLIEAGQLEQIAGQFQRFILQRFIQ